MGHVDGHEENGDSENLIWSCRRCNVECANSLRRAGLGRLTRQYNAPTEGAQSLGQWMTAVLSMKGQSDAMSVPAAVELIRQTPPSRRSEFAREIWERRRARAGEVPF